MYWGCRDRMMAPTTALFRLPNGPKSTTIGEVMRKKTRVIKMNLTTMLLKIFILAPWEISSLVISNQ